MTTSFHSHVRLLVVLGWVGLLASGPLMGADEQAKIRHTVPDVPYIQQSHRNTCGAAALAMLVQYHGKKTAEQDLIAAYPKMERAGFYVPWLWEYSGKAGFQTASGATTADAIKKLLRSNTPVIVYQFSAPSKKRPHFRVVVGYDDERKHFIIWDPTPQLGKGYKMSYQLFESMWRLRYFGARTHFYFAITGVLPPAPSKADVVLYRHPERYAAFPSLFRSPTDQLWVSFGWNTTRSHYGAAAGGQRGGVSLFSPDGGATWLTRGKDEGYRELPNELHAFALRDGSLLTISPRMHEVLPLSKKAELEKRGIVVKVWPAGHISACYRVLMRRKAPGAKAFASSYPKLPPFASMAGFGRGVVLKDGTILKPVYGLAHKDDPADRTWVLRSTDNGASWQLITVAYDGSHTFNEADLLALPGGRVLAMIRAFGGRGRAPRRERGFLWQCVSDDGGKTWSQPAMTPIWGYPPHLLLTREGHVLCTYGYRRVPYGIRACFSRDGGRTWDVANEVVLRWDALPEGPGRGRGSPGDLGYPRTVQLRDGTFLTVYYITLGDGVTHIAATKWPRGYVGPRDLKRGAAAVPKPDPALPPEHLIGEVGPVRLVYGQMQSFIPTQPQIKMVAIRVSRQSAQKSLTHTHGLYVAVRKPAPTTWWTSFLGRSRTLKPAEVKIGGWNAFVFDKPVPVTPGETYVLTVYNLDYIGGGPTRLKPGLTGDHAWYLNSSRARPDRYPNGGMSAGDDADLAFKVYAQPGPLPKP